MPYLQANVPNQEWSLDQIQRGPDSIQQLHRPQFQVQPHYLSINNSFNNSCLSPQTNVSGGLQQQHEPLFEMLGSQGLQYSIIGNINFRPAMTLNNEDNHTKKNL
ncbi:hypothetical protein H5410_006110 [Solanum commersonii]|uniref:Uncharacterized protein n=1 Tax=Solanum commersonii TaxID=4109 RepID=A0A9J6A998_SOLCO|nr:hypothetical protein H5410_006110 [Solanum commersonii]